MFPGGGLVDSRVCFREIYSGNEEQSFPLSREYAALSAQLAITEQISLHECAFKWQAVQHPGLLMYAHMHALCVCKNPPSMHSTVHSVFPTGKTLQQPTRPSCRNGAGKTELMGQQHISKLKSGIAAHCTDHNLNSTCPVYPPASSSHTHVRIHAAEEYLHGATPSFPLEKTCLVSGTRRDPLVTLCCLCPLLHTGVSCFTCISGSGMLCRPVWGFTGQTSRRKCLRLDAGQHWQ